MLSTDTGPFTVFLRCPDSGLQVKVYEERGMAKVEE